MPQDPTFVGDPLLHQQVGDYRVIEKVRQGGMGALYKVEDADGKVLALKVLLPELADDPDVAHRLLSELKAARAAPHPNIIDVYAVGRLKDGRHYMVMEYLTGSPLSEVLSERGPFTVAQVVSVLEQSASALEAAHAAGVIHRDIKPGNIFLDERDGQWHLTLLDFGIAKRLSSANMTAPNALVGTPSYMAPEQIRGEAITNKTDIYALGTLGWELLVGKSPFEGGSFVAVMQRQLVEEPPRVSTMLADVPPELDLLLDAMMNKSPDARPDAAEVLRRLPGKNPFDQADRTEMATPQAPVQKATRRFGAAEIQAHAAAFEAGFANEKTQLGSPMALPFEPPERTQVAVAPKQDRRTVRFAMGELEKTNVADVSQPVNWSPVGAKLLEGKRTEAELPALDGSVFGRGTGTSGSKPLLPTLSDVPTMPPDTLPPDQVPPDTRPPPPMFRPAPPVPAGQRSKGPPKGLSGTLISTWRDPTKRNTGLIVGFAGLIIFSGLVVLLWLVFRPPPPPMVIELPPPPSPIPVTPIAAPVAPVEPAPAPTPAPAPAPVAPAPRKWSKADAEHHLKNARTKAKSLSAAKKKKADAALDRIEAKLRKGADPTEMVRQIDLAVR